MLRLIFYICLFVVSSLAAIYELCPFVLIICTELSFFAMQKKASNTTTPNQKLTSSEGRNITSGTVHE